MDDQAITRWAWIDFNLSRVREEWLKSEGLTWDDVRQAHDDAHAQYTGPVETEFGRVQEIFDAPVQWKATKQYGNKPPFKRKLKRTKLERE